MIILGFLLAAAGAVFGLDLLWKNKFRVPDPVAFGQSLGVTSGRWLFVIGVLVGAAIVLGVALVMAGLGRKATKAVAAHKDKKHDREAGNERDALQADNDNLRRQLDQQQVAETPSTVTSGRHYRAGATSTDVTGDDPAGQR